MRIALMIATILLALSGCCDVTAPDSPTSAPSCNLDACPSGVFEVCEVGDFISPCCQDGAPFQACALAAGRLTHVCTDDCGTRECAVDNSGATTCCMFGGIAPNPCDQ